MRNRFYFKNVEIEEQLKSFADFSLGRILDGAPADSTAVALLEKQEDGYRCSVDVYSHHGPFMASTVKSTAAGAIYATEEKLKDQIRFWWSHRETSRKFSKGRFLEAVS